MAITHRIVAWTIRQLGGRASARVVAVFAAVFALDSADKGAIGAMAVQLEQRSGNRQDRAGLVADRLLAVGILATLPFGWLADRTNRTRVLAIAIALWGAAMGLSATVTSYRELLLARLALGVVVAAAVPTVASLVGDYFQPHVRGRMYGYILAGELIGTGFGYIVSGGLVLLSWRTGFRRLGVGGAAGRLAGPPSPGAGSRRRRPVGAGTGAYRRARGHRP